MGKFILQGCIVVPAEDLVAVLAELPNHIALTRAEVGCKVFDVRQDPSAENVFIVYEEFINRAAFDSHQHRVHASRWGEVAVNAKRDYQITEG